MAELAQIVERTMVSYYLRFRKVRDLLYCSAIVTKLASSLADTTQLRSHQYYSDVCQRCIDLS